MAENILKQAYESGTPMFDVLVGTVQNELSKIQQNRELAKRNAQALQDQKELITFKNDLDLKNAKYQSDLAVDAQKDFFDYKLENTPTEPEPAFEYPSIKDQNTFRQQKREEFERLAGNAIQEFGPVDVQLKFSQDAEGNPIMDYVVPVGDGVVKADELLRSYMDIDKALKLKDTVLEKLEENAINVDSVKMENDLSNNVFYMGRQDAKMLINFTAQGMRDNPEEFARVKEVIDRYRSGRIQLNTLDVDDTGQKEQEKLLNTFRSVYTSMYQYSQQQIKDRWIIPDKKLDMSLGGIIKRLENDNTALGQNALDRALFLVNNYGQLGEGFIGKDPLILYPNLDQAEVNADPRRILISKEEFEEKQKIRTGMQGLNSNIPIPAENIGSINAQQNFMQSVFNLEYGEQSGN